MRFCCTLGWKFTFMEILFTTVYHWDILETRSHRSGVRCHKRCSCYDAILCFVARLITRPLWPNLWPLSYVSCDHESEATEYSHDIYNANIHLCSQPLIKVMLRFMVLCNINMKMFFSPADQPQQGMNKWQQNDSV